ncbi:hypothetical protein QFZ80_005872 [Paenibacillus sp. V4I7]|nr:hypothetical protein [Paenibacillus sp. V4I7]MDQ0919461.1 hypothetical protein [Paenibacillus sp. V4I5]
MMPTQPPHCEEEWLLLDRTAASDHAGSLN